VHTLINVVSKNGNLLLSIPVRGNGTIDEQEQAIVEEIGQWIAVNGEGIYDTRPWSVFGEGPVMEAAATSPAPGGNEVKSKPFTAADIRFTAKGDALYAFVMGWPEDGKVSIKSLRSGSPHLQKGISRVEFIGRGSPLAFKQTAEGLQITLPADRPALPYAFALKIA
jgi:alpha-L-fucosidase